MSVLEFLKEQKPTEYWRAVEIAEQLGRDILELKETLERYVDEGVLERGIFTKKKVTQVGYRIKSDATPEKTVKQTEKGKDWERAEEGGD